MTDTRQAFVRWCVSMLGAPYVWGAKGPDVFDCSGFVTFGLRIVGHKADWRHSHNSQALFDALEPTEKPTPGTLCFYGRHEDEISHVMVFVDGRVIGASGGNSRTTTPEIARLIGASVKFKPRPAYPRMASGASDFIGFREPPFP